MKTRWTVKKGLCRLYQYVMKVGMCLLPWRMPNRLIGPGTVEKLPAAIKRRNYRKILVVTDKDLSALHLLDGMLAALDKEGLQWTLYDGVSQNPPDTEVEEGIRYYKEGSCDCMIAFGGGSPMDCAKAIAARIARPKKSVKKLQGLFKVLRPVPMQWKPIPIICITADWKGICGICPRHRAYFKRSL